MTIPMPPDAEYPLDERHNELYGPETVLHMRDGEAHIEYPGGYNNIVSAEKAVEAGRALLYWAAWKREQDVIVWLAAEEEHRKALRRLGLYNKGRLGRGA